MHGKTEEASLFCLLMEKLHSPANLRLVKAQEELPTTGNENAREA